MAVNSVLAPFPTFFDAAGLALENGYIYIGAAGFEARSTPKASFFDVALTIPTGTASGAAIRTKGGFPINQSGAPAMFYVDGDFSISICDRNGVLLYSALSATLALNVGGAVGPILAPDGNLAATGFGFVNETNTGFVRSGAGVMQTVVGGVLVAQQTPAGTVFQQPVSGAGFDAGVLAVAQAKDDDLTALAGLSGTGLAVRTAGNTWAQRQIASADGSVTITNPGGIAGNIDLSVGGGTPLASWAYSSNVTSIPLIGLAGWDSVVVTGFLTVSANVQLRVSPDNGSTWRSTNYVWRVLDEGGATDPTDGMDLCRIGSGSIQFDITLQRMSQASRATYASGNARHGNPRMNTFAGIHNVSEVINAVQIVGATISAGYVDVYGIRRA